MRITSLVVWSAMLGALAVPGAPVLCQESAKSQAELVTALHRKHVPLSTGIAAASKMGKPISAKYEYEGGKLSLSVYTERSGHFSEVLVNPRTGKVHKSEKITEGEDYKAAEGQSAATSKATSSLATAVGKALAANAGYAAVSVTATMKDGQPTAEITLMKNSEFKTVTERL